MRLRTANSLLVVLLTKSNNSRLSFFIVERSPLFSLVGGGSILSTALFGIQQSRIVKRS